MKILGESNKKICVCVTFNFISNLINNIFKIHRFLAFVINLYLPGSWKPFYVIVAANRHVFREEEIVQPFDEFWFCIHTFLLRCQKQRAPKKENRFDSNKEKQIILVFLILQESYVNIQIITNLAKICINYFAWSLETNCWI